MQNKNLLAFLNLREIANHGDAGHINAARIQSCAKRSTKNAAALG